MPIILTTCDLLFEIAFYSARSEFYLFVMCLPFKKRQIVESSKGKEFAETGFKFDENDKKFSKQVKNTVCKGEIAHYEQFLLFPQTFQKTYTADM